MISPSNGFLLLPLIAWAIAQGSKLILSFYNNRFSWRVLVSGGGMPSAHTATVVSLATSTLGFEGASSPIFGVTAVLAGIVVYDSLGVRRASGNQAQAINSILKGLNHNSGSSLATPQLSTLIGHKPADIVVGGLIGLAVGLTGTAAYW